MGNVLDRREFEGFRSDNEARGGAGDVAEYLNEKQAEFQAEGKVHSLEATIKEKLKNGSSGVAVRVAIYSYGTTTVPEAEIVGEGETPLIAVANGTGPEFRDQEKESHYDPDASFIAFFTLEGGQLVRRDVLKGLLTSGDMDLIREQAAKQRESIRIGKEINRQMTLAKEKEVLDQKMLKELEAARTTAKQRPNNGGRVMKVQKAGRRFQTPIDRVPVRLIIQSIQAPGCQTGTPPPAEDHQETKAQATIKAQGPGFLTQAMEFRLELRNVRRFQIMIRVMEFRSELRSIQRFLRTLLLARTLRRHHLPVVQCLRAHRPQPLHRLLETRRKLRSKRSGRPIMEIGVFQRVGFGLT